MIRSLLAEYGYRRFAAALAVTTLVACGGCWLWLAFG